VLLYAEIFRNLGPLRVKQHRNNRPGPGIAPRRCSHPRRHIYWRPGPWRYRNGGTEPIFRNDTHRADFDRP
jgi:hypothetical protein